MKLKFEFKVSWRLKLKIFEFEEVWSWRNLNLKKFEVEEIWNWKTLSWRNLKLKKFEVEEIWCWRNLELKKFEVEELWGWKNLKLKKFEEMEVDIQSWKRITGLSSEYIFRALTVRLNTLLLRLRSY